MTDADATGYHYSDADAPHTAKYLWHTVKKELSVSGVKRIFELGCGNGAFAAELSSHGYNVVGADPSEDGIRLARDTHPDLNLHLASAYDPLAHRFGRFPAVVSLEVVEHVFYPRKYAKCVFDLLEPGGIAILSTPYHGYFKNIAMALYGKMDHHYSPLWDYGHIKFWSIKTLTALLTETGFEVIRFHRVGRIPALAKSMIAVARRPN
jgi:2-polyprenyl-3-methyl-5-hydroxy-6-metoxy-1,4-benzoquinol methylase